MAPESALSRYDVTGLVPQMNWNNTIQLSQWNATDIAGGTAHIASPNPGVLVNSAGSPTGITVNWSANATSSAGNSGSATGILLDSALWTNSDTVQATVSFQNVPFSSYEVLVYLTSSFDDAEGEITCTPSVGRESRFRLESAAPQKQLLELLYPSTPPYAGSFYRRRANTARFRVNGSSSFTLALSRVSWHEVGIAGVQIVNIQADADGDGMSDAYEVTHRLRPAVNDAGLDPDSDGLTNLGEFQRGTRPDVRDTDGDGLSDAVETGTGVYVSPSNTGSLAVHADSDGDTLSDGEEVHGRTYITSPVVQDTDGDGIGDLAELRQYLSDPTTSAPAAALPPGQQHRARARPPAAAAHPATRCSLPGPSVHARQQPATTTGSARSKHGARRSSRPVGGQEGAERPEELRAWRGGRVPHPPRAPCVPSALYFFVPKSTVGGAAIAFSFSTANCSRGL
jgi:hypothetical protein